MNTTALPDTRRIPYGALALLVLLYFVGGKLSIWLTVMPEGMAILRIPNAVVLAALLILRGRHYFLIAVSAIVAEIAVCIPQFTILEALLFGVTDVAEATLAFLLLQRFAFDPKFGKLADEALYSAKSGGRDQVIALAPEERKSFHAYR
jgi:integral membrane sensor domain MASE1